MQSQRSLSLPAMVQPQPHGGSTLQWEMTGEETLGAGSQGSLMASSSGSLRVPPDLAGNEIFQKLMTENHQLREALKRSNDALKERCEEMEGWQRRSREEREFLNCRFREARALVERLAGEKQSLLVKLNNNNASQMAGQSPGNSAEMGYKDRNQGGSSNGLADSPEDLDGVGHKDNIEEGANCQGMPRSLGSNENSSICSFTPSLRDSLPCDEGQRREEVEGRACQPIEGSNDFLRLLKSHKEKLEEGMKELRGKNEELMKEKENLVTTVEELRLKITQLMQQGGVVTEESTQKTNAFTVTAERYRELQEKLNILQQNSFQRDRTEALLKQKEKECVQLTKDIEALRAQVTSLLGELHERQSCIDRLEEDKKRLEEKLCSKTEGLQSLERDMEQQKKQNSVTVDKLLLQKQNLETALKNERLVIVEERRKLAQLQHAYTCLFQDYDNKLKSEKQVNHRSGETDLVNRLEEAEKALALKQAHIDKLKEEVEQVRTLKETVEVLTAQADIFKSDFLAEREAREKLHQKKEELQEKLSQALTEINQLKQEKMQQRHRPLQAQATFPGTVMSQPNQPPAETQPDFLCPKCQYRAPDMDTLQIHVMDCIQ